MHTNQHDDRYVHSMDWGEGDSQLSDLSNYRDYQYNLISRYVGANVLEVGSGDRGFTHKLVSRSPTLKRLVSIEPSETLYTRYASKFAFPPKVEFHNLDLFELDADRFGTFDTAVFIHVLEHIEQDREALDHVFRLVQPGGHVLIEVPALPWLYSVHDEAIGHYRRYDKPMLRAAVDPERYRIERLWYQDPIGVLGSFVFFKLRKTKLKSDAGTQLVKNQGAFYDKYLIPFEEKIERFITFPFGLSLTAILQRR